MYVPAWTLAVSEHSAKGYVNVETAPGVVRTVHRLTPVWRP